MEAGKPAWLWALVIISFTTAVLVLLHLGDDFSREGAGTLNQAIIAVTATLLALTWLLAITLSIRQEPTGYGVVLILGVLAVYLALDHVVGLSPSIVDIAQTSGAFFAGVVVALGAASVLTGLLAGLGLIRSLSTVGQEA